MIAAALDALKGLCDLIPGWLYAIFLVVCLGHSAIVTEQRNLARGDLKTLQDAVDKQKAEAAAKLAADTEVARLKQQAIDAAAQRQNQKDKSDVKFVQDAQPGLATALATRGFRLCQPGGSSRGGAAGQVATTARPGAKH